ncbi:MAG: ArsA family ATPase, partial [Lachnospiraceae bacterium]|nr:ArsA family ATPase [Lachnospiraceae bacterium]
MRVIIYTGKGGVGKTSMAAATALKIANSGKKVLIMSTDQAHSLGDSFDCKVGREPTKVSGGLDAMEIDTVYEGEKSWGNIKDYFKRLLTLKGGSGIETEELLVFPGLEELFSMFKILDMAESGLYDVIIVDCAPTGETLSL